VVWPQDNKLHFYYFDTREEYESVLVQVRDTVTSSEIKGDVACKGIAEDELD